MFYQITTLLTIGNCNMYQPLKGHLWGAEPIHFSTAISYVLCSILNATH